MRSVVLLSGGIDSAVALDMTLDTTDPGDVEALAFNYGQRHQRELNAAYDIALHYGVKRTCINIDPQLFTGSAITRYDVPLPKEIATEPDATYVPARNTVFLALAAARAESLGATRVVIGCNADDAGAYPDCRADYIHAMRDVLQRGTLRHIWVLAPLIYHTKAEVLDAARMRNVPIHKTWSCYEGLAAGPCGSCGACLLREQAGA